MTARRPTQTRGRQRSAKKTPTAGRRYTPEEKAEALALVESHGTAHAHRTTGVPKPTLSRWAKAAGLDTTDANRRRTAAAAEANRARAAEVTASTVDLLEAHIAQAGDYLGTVAGVNALAARLIAGTDPGNLERVVTLTGTHIAVNDAQADEVIRVAEALGNLPLAVRDAEGIVTRAIHDLQLLRGEATERGELSVEFNVPRPTPPADTDVVELPAAPEE